ncbi:DUF7139 domain-containing protein [Halorientalis salina]|uniref:DUF7139 domain-containing protein n=1 Tax=Halorientalis salina TaxID=2932266 RepID=UPI0010AD9FE3|nr:hypothetical protein [Halorientalis salina]
MPSLSEAYDGRRGGTDGRDPRRVALGAGVSLCGAGALVTALLVVTTPLAAVFGATDPLAAKHLAGVLAGLGGPAILLGVVAVLPSKRRQQLGVIAGAAIATAGVWLFSYAYPSRWVLAEDPLVFETAIVYFIGGFVALWFVFVALANFRRRNNPHGRVTLEIQREGETQRVEVSRSEYRAMVGDGGSADDILTELDERRGE